MISNTPRYPTCITSSCHHFDHNAYEKLTIKRQNYTPEKKTISISRKPKLNIWRLSKWEWTEKRSGCGRLAMPVTSPRSGAASGSQRAPGASATGSSASTGCRGGHTKTLRLYQCRRRSGPGALYEHPPTETSVAAAALTRVTTATTATATIAGVGCHSAGAQPRPRPHPRPMVERRRIDPCRPGCQRTMQTRSSSEITCPSCSPIHRRGRQQPIQRIVPAFCWTSAALPESPAAQAVAHISTISAQP